MKKIANIFISISIMILVSIVGLCIISLLAYSYKWKADTAMLGITLTYILSAFCGGLGLKWIPVFVGRKKGEVVLEQQVSARIGNKMTEGLLAGSGFMLFLFILSIFLIEEGVELSSRMFVIWMLLTGSACLGRVL